MMYSILSYMNTHHGSIHIPTFEVLCSLGFYVKAKFLIFVDVPIEQTSLVVYHLGSNSLPFHS